MDVYRRPCPPAEEGAPAASWAIEELVIAAGSLALGVILVALGVGLAESTPVAFGTICVLFGLWSLFQ